MIAIVLMVLGALGLGYGFLTGSNNSVEDAKAAIAHHEAEHNAHHPEGKETHQETAHDEHTTHDEHASHDTGFDKVGHAQTQLNNRPWSALYVPLFYFFMIALAVFVFYAMQIGASAGWSIVLFRVMEAMSRAIVPLGILLVIFMGIAAYTHLNHIFPWIHYEGVDKILEGKAWWLNANGWFIRSVIYIAGFIFFRYIIIKNNHEQDSAPKGNFKAHEKAFKYTIMFIGFFLITETLLSIDWVMSLDPHWFSSLFAWYIFASSIVTGITLIAVVVIYLKSIGYLKNVNNSHIHDLAKYMFGFSIFWTYLWFAQYMLIWYSNMPEETTYFMQRMMQYKTIFYAMPILNLLFPFLILMDSDYKRISWIVVFAGLFILVGHYIDFFVMIMPSTTGAYWHFGIPEIGGILFFLGLFVFCGFHNLQKRALVPKNNPYLQESEHYHY